MGLKKRDFNALSVPDLKAKLKEMEAEIAGELSAMKSSGRPSNAGRLRNAKRLKARILTLLTLKGEKSS